MSLDRYQKECVGHFYGPAIIIAGPGSGKTKTMSHRISNLIEKENIDPKKIVAISFTKASATELKDRTVLLNERAQKVNFGTFHGFFYRLLRMNGLSKNIMLEYDAYDMIKKLLARMGFDFIEEIEIKKIVNAVSIKQNNDYFKDPSPDFELTLTNLELERLLCLYREEKQKEDLYDFEELILKTHEMLQDEQTRKRCSCMFSHFMIDEFQDINKAQYETIRLLLSKDENICVVGDDDQSIYRFRGADPGYFIKFQKNFPSVRQFFLSSNYRSKKLIIDFSQKIIKENFNRYKKDVDIIRKDEGEISLIDVDSRTHEAKFIANQIILKILEGSAPNEIAIIYRLNRTSNFLVNELTMCGVKFYIKDGADSMFQSSVYKDIEAYMRASLHNDSASLARIINKPGKYIKNEDIKRAQKSKSFFSALSPMLKSYQREQIYDFQTKLQILKGKSAHDFIKGLKAIGYYKWLIDPQGRKDVDRMKEAFNGLLEFSKKEESLTDFMKRVRISQKQIDESRQNDPKESVLLTTMHGSKGLEFEHVFIAACNEGTTPFKKAATDDEIEEERRMFYVAATRAKDSLTMTSYHERTGAKRTRFLNFLETDPIKEKIKIV